MKGVVALVCLEYAANVVFAASPDSGRPRGVSPDFAKFYKDAATFTCISNPSLTFPIARVNDDYCDCPDGSDEPGTAACAHLSPLSPQTAVNAVGTAGSNTTLALPGFYCKNKGHVASYIPFTRVNDGVCDYELCCDGSEEWDGVGTVKCEDRCQQIGKDSRRVEEQRQKSLANATKKRKELVAQAQRLRKEVEDRIQTLGTEIQGGERKVVQLEKELVEIERKEKGKMVRSSVPKKAGKLGIVVGLAKQRTEELKNALVRVRGERDSNYDRLVEVEAILATFKEEYNPNFNDEGVKRAVRAWEDYAARDKTGGSDAAHDRDLDAIAQSDKENGLDWEEYEGGDDTESETDVLYAFEAYLPPTIRAWLDTKLRDLRVTLIENGILADTSRSSSDESKVVTDAKARLSTAKENLERHQKDVTTHQEDLKQAFGPDDVFRALKDTCISHDSGEYTYEVCFMSRTTQKSKKGGMQTNMGNYASLEQVEVDEGAVPADGKGLGTGPRWVMKYEHGQHCWNGPDRTTTVVLGCSEEAEVWRIVEEEKCIYRMEVGTPAVCGVGEGRAKVFRDEL